jgi:hypothetical protein
MHMALTRTFKARAVAVFIMLGYVLFSTPLLAAVDFESDFESPTAMTEDGWFAAINYFTTDCTTYVSSPYAFPAPDNGPQVSALTAGATSQVVNIYSNYDDSAQTTNCLETNVFQEINPITEADVGEYVFSYDVELPAPANTGDKVNGFVKVLKSDFSGVLLNEVEPSTAGSKTITVTITPEMVGNILQFGFNNYAYNYEASGMWYDNASFTEVVAPPPQPPVETLINFETDFESPTAMTEDGWIAAINYFTTDCTTYVSSPYAFPAPDNGPQVSALTAGATSQVVNIYSNYDDPEQTNFCLETNVFQEVFPITEAHVGDYIFSYDVELPAPENTGDKVNGFVKVLTSDYSAVLLSLSEPSIAGTTDITLSITKAMVGGRLQFGFNNYAYNYEASGMWYDNVRFVGFFEGIPTLGNWGMLLMIMLLGVVGAVVLIRRV